MSIWSKLFRRRSSREAQISAGKSSLNLPPELERGDGTVNLNAVFATHTRERLLAILDEMPIEHLNFSQPGASHVMNRAATVSIHLVRYLAAANKKEYGDLVIPRFLDQLDRYSLIGIHPEVAAQLEHVGVDLINGGRPKEAVRCFRLLEGTPFGPLIRDRVSDYIFTALYNIAMVTKSKDDVREAINASEKLSPQAKQENSAMISRLNSLR